MEFFQILRAAGVVALLSIVIALLPLPAGVAYALRPTEARMALMRPISLAALFAGLDDLGNDATVCSNLDIPGGPISVAKIHGNRHYGSVKPGRPTFGWRIADHAVFPNVVRAAVEIDALRFEMSREVRDGINA